MLCICLLFVPCDLMSVPVQMGFWEYCLTLIFIVVTVFQYLYTTFEQNNVSETVKPVWFWVFNENIKQLRLTPQKVLYVSKGA